VDLAAAAWRVEAVGDQSHVPANVRGRAFPARVPGCVHSDLIRAGVLGHPNIGDNEEWCQWIGRTDWRYRCRFEIDAESLAHERIDLVLDGLDTIAAIDINGQRVGEAMNMHHAHRFGCRQLLRRGDNELIITLCGPVSYVEEQERRLGARPVNGDWIPYPYIRKMASNFQWDWGPKVATCGIWRGARLEAWSGVRIAFVRPRAMQAGDRDPLPAGTWFVDVHVDLDWPEAAVTSDLNVMAEIREDQNVHAFTFEGIALRQPSLVLRLSMLNTPELWWPRGSGPQRLYPLDVWVNRCTQPPDAETLDSRSMRIGFRTPRVNTNEDADGSSFSIEVNGRPIFCQGANWIPEGLFPEDQSPQRLRQRVQQAADANCNMLRVWGGGTYEHDAFYNACDELGIMVWQDFMFACATYPEDEPYPALVEREAREAVTRLAHHPSIVLWCGGNENILGYESWGWKQRMPRDQKWGERYFLDILPRMVRELDPSRPYWPDSPYSGSREMHPNDPDRGDRHTWDAKVEGYREIVPRFCSEFGHQSPPCWASMREAWGEDQLRLDSRAMIHRQRATGGNDVWYGPKVMGPRFAVPRDLDQWLYQAHLLQARAISIGIEWMRANQPRCMGALFWQFNDAWAGHSWSCIDSAGRRKPLWYAVKRSFAPRLLTIQPFGGDLWLCVMNDLVDTWSADVRVRRMRMTGEIVRENVRRVSVDARAAVRVARLAEAVGSPTDPRAEFIVAECVGEANRERARTFWFFDHDRALELPTPRLEATSARTDGAIQLTLTAHTLVRDAVIAVDRVDPAAEIDDNLITLLSGESRIVRITTHRDVPAAIWTSAPVFRCANEFSAGDRA